MELSEHPISNIKWVDVNLLRANDYNPNYVMGPEMDLIAFSLLAQGWIQPILACPSKEGDGTYTIIDGFHRHLTVRQNKKVWAMTDGKVPLSLMTLSEPERMMLTIRINRAKGSHAAIRMHEIVTKLVKEHDLSYKEVQDGIGATKEEVEALLQANVFEAKQVDRHHYSKSWVPTDCANTGGVQ